MCYTITYMNKKIKIVCRGEDYYALVSETDFEELSKFKWVLSTDKYAIRASRKTLGEKSHTTISMHRQIMSPPLDMQVDHINGKKLDNRRENLRICTRTENSRNRGACKNNTSGYKGVWKNGNRWSVYIYHNGKNMYGGSFISKEDAALAYNELCVKLHGKFAFINKVKGSE